MKKLGLSRILADTSIIGGQIEMQLGHIVSRGFVKNVHADEFFLHFDLGWCAREGVKFGTWEGYNTPVHVLEKSSVCFEQGKDGTIYFWGFGVLGQIFPQTQSEHHVDPKNVINIKEFGLKSVKKHKKAA